jgi:(1->4)-alpha-D-glucan 1-alpha-D-glucosylmutase
VSAVHQWRELASRLRSPEGWPDRETEYLFWQTVVATWNNGPADPDRIVAYLAKATREAKIHTTWTSPDAEYDGAVEAFARAALADPAVLERVGGFCATLAEPTRVAVLGQKLVQLTMPGVADVYQGSEIVDLSLVDPDNRRPVDYERRGGLLTAIDDAGPEGDRPIVERLGRITDRERLDAEKLLVTSRALRLRRERPEWFTAGSGYTPVATSAGNALAFGRGAANAGPGDEISVVTVATRLPVALARYGGWAGHTVSLPSGDWTDLLTGRAVSGGSLRLADLLADLPVALLTRR